MFLIETKLSVKKMEIVKRRLGFYGCLVVDSVGRSGGLVLLCKEDCTIQIMSYSRLNWYVWAP